MKKIILISLFILTFIGLAYKFQAKQLSAVGGRASFTLPEKAREVKPGLYYLGRAFDTDGREVEGYAHVHGKSDAAIKQARPPKGGTKCYGYLASGAKWKGVEPWLVNPANTRGLNGGVILNTLQAGIGKWESAALSNILGSGSSTSDTLEADTSSPDNINEVYFADITDSNAIAVTIVWGYFSGPPQTRQLLEWDQIYDDVTYDWSEDAFGSTTKMDLDNIVTHELGHSFGMDDIYTDSCSAVTMFGYADYGETDKRSLEQADIDGVKTLYR